MANCPGTSNNGNPELKDGIEIGCQSAVTQAVDGVSPGPNTPALLAACPIHASFDPAVPDDCLNADPGNFNNTLAASWDVVIARQEAIPVPVFCGTPPCSPAAINDDGGGNVVDYPIYRIVSVEICGYHFGNSDNQRHDGLCADSNMPLSDPYDPTIPMPYRATDGDNQTNYFLVVFRNEVFGPVFGASTCTIGDSSCDGGLRRTALVE